MFKSEASGWRLVWVRPQPRVTHDPASESLVMIPLVINRGRPVKANVSLDAGQLEAIDAEAARRGLTR